MKMNNVGAKKEVKLKEIHLFMAEHHLFRRADTLVIHATYFSLLFTRHIR